MKISEFLSENFQFLLVKFSVYLNRHVFVMYAHIEGPDQFVHPLYLQSGPSLSTYRIIGYYKMYEWRAKARMIFCTG